MLKNKPKEKKELFFSENTGKIFALGGIIFIILIAIIFLISGNWTFSKTLNEEKIGQFGDFIGGVIGSLFSLAGVILFYIALKEQRRDININQENLRLQTEALNLQVNEFKDQKTELIETRKVYEEQTALFREQTNLYVQQYKEIKEQTNTAKLQHFDSSFFSHLNVFIEFKKNLNDGSKTKNYFNEIFSEISEIDVRDNTLVESLELIRTKYLTVFHKYKSNLSHYFKTFYRLIILIDSSNIEEAKKYQYFKLLRSQLSDDELLVLYYNYQTHLGAKVRSYVIKYNLLKHIRILDKIEIGSELKLEDKFEMEDFLSEIGYYILESIQKYSNIEETEDVDLSINKALFGIELEIRIKIEGEFQFSLICNNVDIEAHRVLKRDIIKKLMSRQIYSILFLSKFKIPTETEVQVSVIECLPKLEFSFKIENISKI